MGKNGTKLPVLLITIITLFCSYAYLEEVNLIKNGSFEHGGLGWSLGVSGTLDPSTKFEKNNSIKMYGIPTNNWNVVTSEMIPIEANQQYILTFMSKNDSLKGTVKVMIRWIAGNTTITYTSLNLRNDTDWEDYTLIATSPNGASKAQVYLQVMPDFAGYAWFNNFVLAKAKPSFEPQIISAGPIGFKGSVLTEISYTPEERWIAGNRLQIYTDLAFGTRSKGYINLGGWMPREDVFHSFASLSSIPANLRIKYAYLEVDGPLLGRFFNIRTTLGDLSIDYSPFIMKRDRLDLWYWDVMDNPDDPANYNRGRRGISFETLNPDKIGAGGFLLCDGDPNQYAYGSKFSCGSAKNNLELIFVNYEDHKGSLQGEKAKNTDSSFSIEGRLGKGPLGIWGQGVQDRKVENQQSLPLTQLLQGSLTYQAGDFATIAYSVWSFDKDFDPRYRDRTPKYDLQTGRKLMWNPVDKFAGQSGTGLRVAFNNGDIGLKLENRQALEKLDKVSKLQETELKFNTEFKRVLFSLEAEYSTNQVDAENELLSIKKSIFASSSYMLKKTSGYDLSLEWNHNIDENAGSSESRSHLILNSKVASGSLEGAQIFAGIRKISNFDKPLRGFICGLDLLLAREINIVVRYAVPNEAEQLNSAQRIPRYDERGNPVLADNIVKLSLNVEF